MVNIKFIGQQYWSKSAIQKYCENNPINIKKNIKELRHEHAVPRIMIKKKLLKSLKKITKTEKVNRVYSTIKTFSKSVILTKIRFKSKSKNKMSFNVNDKIFRTLNPQLQRILNEGDCIIKILKI